MELELQPIWIAAMTLAGAVAGNTAIAVHTFLTVRRARRSWEAAQALLDVHLEAVDTNIQRVSGTVVGVSARGQLLSTKGSAAGQTAKDLVWLLGRIPEERSKLGQAVVDAVLPTPEEQGAR